MGDIRTERVKFQCPVSDPSELNQATESAELRDQLFTRY